MLPTATTTYFTPRVARTKTSHNSHLAAIVAASQNIRVVLVVEGGGNHRCSSSHTLAHQVVFRTHTNNNNDNDNNI